MHAARLVAAEGVTRLVAAKRLHPHFTDDPEFVAMFHDEARIASRIHHPNVVPVLDVVHEGEELILVQEYVHGVPLSQLLKLSLSDEPIPVAISVAIVFGVLAGLHAAHEATDEYGEALEIVHRDVSPQNVIVSVDGIPRLVDFGIAKAKTSVHHTREGFFKGKLSYMSPEQLRAETVTRHADIYAAGVLLWEALVNRRFYDGKGDADFVRAIALGSMPTLTQALEGERERGGVPMSRWADIVALEPIVSRAMSANPNDRYATAADMAAALASAVPPAPPGEVAIFVKMLGAELLEKRQKALLANEESWRAGRLELHQHMVMEDASSHSVRSSGARMRLVAEQELAMLRRERPTEPAFGELATTLPSAPSAAPMRGPAPSSAKIEKRALIPWVVVAGLFVVIGLLTGMVLVRPSLSPVATPAPTAAPPSETAGTAPVAAEPEVTTASAPTTRPPPSVVTVVRYVPVPANNNANNNANNSNNSNNSANRAAPAAPLRGAQSSPTPVPTPTPLGAKADCTPPFYFEGTKKIFKPACL